MGWEGLYRSSVLEEPAVPSPGSGRKQTCQGGWDRIILEAPLEWGAWDLGSQLRWPWPAANTLSQAHLPGPIWIFQENTHLLCNLKNWKGKYKAAHLQEMQRSLQVRWSHRYRVTRQRWRRGSLATSPSPEVSSRVGKSLLWKKKDWWQPLPRPWESGVLL